MMVDNPENNEFRQLLREYAAPIDEDGFTGRVLNHALKPAQIPKNIGRIKNLMIGGATLLAALLAVPQLAKLKQLLVGVQLPDLSLPTNIVESTNTANMTIMALLAVLILGLGSSFLFSSDM